jgi:hypothetical protein
VRYDIYMSLGGKGLIANLSEHSLKMEQTECSETLTIKLHTPEKNPKRTHSAENIMLKRRGS